MLPTNETTAFASRRELGTRLASTTRTMRDDRRSTSGGGLGAARPHLYDVRAGRQCGASAHSIVVRRGSGARPAVGTTRKSIVHLLVAHRERFLIFRSTMGASAPRFDLTELQ
jgi:hypothetical protein